MQLLLKYMGRSLFELSRFFLYFLKMGAGQIGGIATLLDINFENAAGFAGRKATVAEGQFVVYYLSHATLFCTGALIEAHVVLTPATCVHGEQFKFDVYAGTHMFVESLGTARQVENVCIHKGYNHTYHDHYCSDNLALLVLNKQYSFREHESGSEYFINRIRYGLSAPKVVDLINTKCHIYGWGSRRNGYLIPLLIDLQRLDVKLLPCAECHQMWNPGNKYLCIEEPPCKSEKFGALSPDDLGSALICDGYIRGIMTTLLVDRPAGVGFLDLDKYKKFLTCGVDDARDVVIQSENEPFAYQYGQQRPLKPTLVTVHTKSETEATKTPK